MEIFLEWCYTFVIHPVFRQHIYCNSVTYASEISCSVNLSFSTFHLRTFLSKGEQHYHDDADKRRVLIYNFLAFLCSFTVFPTAIWVSVLNENSFSIFATIGIFLIVIGGMFLNWNGQNQVAVIVLTFSILVITHFSLLLVPYQTGAPYGNLLLAQLCLLLIRNRAFRLFVLALAIASFIINNYVQLKFKQFDDAEFLPIIFMILLMFVALVYHDHLIEKFQDKIRIQGKQLLELEKDKHQQAIDLKQKDLENALAIFSVRDKVTSQLTEKLKNALTTENLRREVHRLVIELQNQNESIRGKALISQNVNEVNADFYARLSSNFSDLTKGDLELCAFLRLNLSNKEIEQLRNTGKNSVNMAKARLKKKLSIGSNKELVRFLQDF